MSHPGKLPVVVTVYGGTPNVGLNELAGYSMPASARDCGKHTTAGPGAMVIGHPGVVAEVTPSRNVNVGVKDPDCVGVPVTNPDWFTDSPAGNPDALHVSAPFPPELVTRVGV